MPKSFNAILAAAVLLSACSTTSSLHSTTCGTPQDGRCIEASNYFSQTPEARSVRQEETASAQASTQEIGLALAGGGTRASQISIGIFQGLRDAGLLDKVTHISTVSGGGYAGYWYMSQRTSNVSADDMFRDCVPVSYIDVGTEAAPTIFGRKLSTCRPGDVAVNSLCVCPNNSANVLVDADNPGKVAQDPFRYQNNLRGHTDLFAPSFSYANTNSDHRLGYSVIRPIAMQVVTASTVDVVGDILFDWNFNSSPSRWLYMEGIKRIYGQPPLDCTGRSLGGDDGGRCWSNRPLQDELRDSTTPPGHLLEFEDLRKAYRAPGSTLPLWIINATTPVLDCSSSSNDWGCARAEAADGEKYPVHRAAFEITPFWWGSGEHGYWRPESSENTRESKTGLSVIEAVASAAAFFDPHEKTTTFGGVVNVFLQTTGFRWGYYIPNPRVSDGQRIFHRFLPFPFYMAHRWRGNREAVDIHLIDGGQSDNLGAYALIRRRVANIIISDHASEAKAGNMEDICALKKSLSTSAFASVNNGKVWHIAFDDLVDLEQVCASSDKSVKDTERLRYNVWAWKSPLVKGCAVEVGEAELESAKGRSCTELRAGETGQPPNAPRKFLNLMLIKPAIDLSRYANVTLATPADIATLPEADFKSEIEIRRFVRNNSCTRTSEGILLFPVHGTVNLTLDSSPWLFGAYRELAASAARKMTLGSGGLEARGPEARSPIHPALSSVVDAEAKQLTEALTGR